jgi:hypothetical protein
LRACRPPSASWRPLVEAEPPPVDFRLYAQRSASQHVSMTTTRTRVWVLALSVPAGPVIGIAAFALFAALAPSLAWPLGLFVLLGVPGFCCYRLGRRVGDKALANAAAILAAVSSLVTAVGLLILALSHLSFD